MDIIHYSLFGTLVREREELALVKDARAHDVELPGQVVKVVALIGISLV